MRFWTSTSIFSVVCVLTGCASYEQTPDWVYLRKSGETLQPWLPVNQAAARHWPFAWAAVAAYEDSYDDYRKPLPVSEECPEPHAFLKAHGWERWRALPLLEPEADTAEPGIKDAMRSVHLRAEVWEHAARKLIIVAFGGTAFRHRQDWKANLHWLLSPFGSHDQYDVLSEEFVRAFQKAYAERSALADHGWLRQARIVAVGHSLGGGLAQRFAYSLPPDAGIPRIKEIYAFDPSPVSGKRGTRYYEDNGKGLTIYRIYNRGEILASIRSTLHWWNPFDRGEQGQTWLDIRYLDDWVPVVGTVRSHGMFNLACFMKVKMSPAELASWRPAPPTQAAASK